MLLAPRLPELTENGARAQVHARYESSGDAAARAPCLAPRRRAELGQPGVTLDSEASHAKGQSWPTSTDAAAGFHLLPGARLMLERRRTGVTRVTADPPGRLQDGSCSWLVPTTGDWSHRARVLGRASRKHPRATNQEHAFHVIAGILT